jgi:excisionase family DNA binding protein
VGEDRTGATGADRRRLTVPQAAEALGVTVDAVRGRIRRGKLEAERDGTGTVYVWVEASP